MILYISASCHISGQHTFGGSAASLHMLSIPGQVFATCYPSALNLCHSPIGCYRLTSFVSVAGEFRKLLAAFVSGSTSKSSGIVRKITPTSAEPKDTQVANRSQQKLQVSLRSGMMSDVKQPVFRRPNPPFESVRAGRPRASLLPQPAAVAAPHGGVCRREGRLQRRQAYEVSIAGPLSHLLTWLLTALCQIIPLN